MDTVNREVRDDMVSEHWGKTGIEVSKPKGTFVAKRIINLTDTVLTLYDHFGYLVTLYPERLRMQHGEPPIIGDGTYVAVDKSVNEELLAKLKDNKYYQGKLVTPCPIGKIHNGKEGYHLIATGHSGKHFFVTVGHYLAPAM